LKAELNTALQCDREAEDEVKKLKVRQKDQNMFCSAHISDPFKAQYKEERKPPSFSDLCINVFDKCKGVCSQCLMSIIPNPTRSTLLI